MRWRLRQVTALVGDLDAAIDEMAATFGMSVSLRDDGTTATAHGISNAWLPLGGTIFELASPAQPGDATDRFHTRFGDGGYMVILQTDDLVAARARLDDHDVRITREIDFPESKELHLDHRDVGGTILAIDWADPPGLWRWAGPDWPSHVRTHVITELLCAEIRTPDPGAVAARWGQLLDRPVTEAGDGRFEIDLDRGALRFVAGDDVGRGRLTGVEVARAPGEKAGREVTAAGLRFRLVDGPPPAKWWD